MKIEVGKIYIDGTGESVEITQHFPESNLYEGYTSTGLHVYDENGKWIRGEGTNYNIVAETKNPFVGMTSQLTNQDRWVLYTPDTQVQ